MNIKRNIRFSLEKRKSKGELIVDNVPIRMRVTYSGNRVEFTTGYRIDVAKWDESRQRVRNGCTNILNQSSAEINADLSKYYSAIQAIFKEFEVKDTIPTPEELKDAFNIRTSDEVDRTQTLSSVFSFFLTEEGSQNNWSESTYKNFRVLENHLLNFDKDITLECIDEDKMSEYVDFLRQERKMRNSSIAKQIQLLKWFLRWGFRKGYIQSDSFEHFNPKFKTAPKKVIFLSEQELNKIRDYIIPETKEYLERVRDVFLFSCFTGLRYSDVRNLRRSDVRNEQIELTTIKTVESLIIELNAHSKAILSKYRDVRFKGDRVLPVISNQKMNEYLKELCQLAEIDEPIRETYYRGNERIDEVTPKYALMTTHAGRRTFICNALMLGIAPQVVMKWTGHSDYKAMKPYIDITDDVKASEMTKFNKL